MFVNPYMPPVEPRPAENSAAALRSGVHLKSAIWFALAFVVHSLLYFVVSYRFPTAVFDFLPYVWLAIAAGLYFRLGPVRRLVLLFGAPLIAVSAVLAILTLTGHFDVSPTVIFGVVVAEESPAFQVMQLLGLAGVFLYPVWRLWPISSRLAFRDRQRRLPSW